MIITGENTKNAFLKDNIYKRIDIYFPNGDHEGFSNSEIVTNTFTFSESLCSENSLKFGLCDADYVSFTAECEDITGSEIFVIISAYYKLSNGNVNIVDVPIGQFTVTSCKKRSGYSLRDVIAYAKSITNNTSWDTLEYFKMSVGVLRNDPYSMALSKVFAVTSQCKDYLQLNRRYGSTITSALVLREDRDVPQYKIEYLYAQIANTQNKIYLLQEYDKDLFSEYKDKLISWGITDKNGKPINIERWYDYSFDIKYSVSSFLQYANLFYPQFVFSSKHYTSEGVNAICDEIISFNTGKLQDFYISGANASVNNWLQSVIIIYPYKITKYNESGGVEDTVIITDLGDDVIEEYIDNATYKYDYSIPRNLTKQIRGGPPTYYVDALDYELDLGNILNSYLEMQGLFAKSDRNGALKLVSINDYFAQYPENDFYPNSNEYPLETSNNYLPVSTVSYKSAEYEDYLTEGYGYVRVAFTGTDGKKYATTIECDPLKRNVYDMTNNYIFLNSTWTAEQVENTILTYFYPNIKDVSYNPASLQIKGLPFVEVGDIINVNADDGLFKTLVLERTLTGDQLLVDQITAKGEKRNENSDAWISLVGILEEN